ncbi:MAG: ComEC/Rec2 family competence protein [Candidatus Moraniibacteriota bacterium]
MRTDQVFLAACLGYIGGVFAGSFFVALWWVILLLCAVFIACAAAFPRRDIAILSFPLALFAFGILSVSGPLDQYREGNMRNGAVSGVGRVVNDPEERDFYRQAVMRMESCGYEYCPQEKILWQAPRTMEIIPGARISFVCALELPKNFDEGFDYRMFLAKDDIGYICRTALKAEVLPEDTRARFTRLFFMPKYAFEMALNKSVPQPEAGLAEGLILGGDNRLPETLKQAFIKAGLSHIVAISGYNIALIAQGFVIFGIVIGLWRRQALWFAVIGIALFVFMVGAPASAIRAGIMGLAAFAALSVGRLSRSINVLVFAAALMLFFQPLLLRYDVGFQLSCLAALAIIVAVPWLERLLPKAFIGKSFVEIALLTFAVELFVVPLLVYQFHIFSPYALLANVLLLPLVPYAMGLSFIGALGFLVLPGLHLLPAGIAYLFLRVITFVAEWISVLPGATAELSIGAGALFLWYASLFFAIVTARKYFQRYYVQTKNIS